MRSYFRLSVYIYIDIDIDIDIEIEIEIEIEIDVCMCACVPLIPDGLPCLNPQPTGILQARFCHRS